MGHTEVEYDSPAPRNSLGKLPYDVKLRASEDRRKRFQSFQQAAADSYGSGSSSQPRFSTQVRRRGNGGLMTLVLVEGLMLLKRLLPRTSSKMGCVVNPNHRGRT